ncbi:glycosyltransferase [Oceanimonas smirnovii]|uniref:glycosyltransferase n=1 Tax=Oceanimonas smirnovii TaxID=264574 RepID=UPI003AABD900
MDQLIEHALNLASQPATLLIAPVKNRIAYVVSHGQSYASHGYAVRTQGVAKALNEHGFDTLCFVRPGRPWELGATAQPESIINGVRYIHSRWNTMAPASEKAHLEQSVQRFIELFRVYRPQAVLAASNYIVGLPAWIAARRLGLPFYNEVRGFWELSQDAREPGYAKTPEFKAEALRDTFVAKQAQKVFTLNQPMTDELIKRGINANNIAIVPNGVSELPEVKPADPQLKAKLGIKDSNKVIGYVGSFNPYEGLETLLDACEQLTKQGETIKLLLVGDDQPITAASSTNKAMADNPWLIQAGRVPHEQIADYYALLDAVVIPRKPLAVCNLVPPMKAAEPLAHGKRLLVSDVAPLAEYANKYDGVISFEAGSAASLVSALQGSLKLPAPKPTTELLFAKHTEPMVKALKGEQGQQGGKSEAVAKQTPAESVAVSKPETTPEAQTFVASKPPVVAEKKKLKKAPKDFKAISIMDEISEECWKYEFNSFRIDRKNYKNQVGHSTATFAFLESCWKGNGGAWEYAFTSPGLKHANAQALLDLIPRLKKRKMPVVFWNKEDPMHYDRYLPIAKQADIIFTTDSNKVPDYQRDVPEADVYAVPFAAQQKICNPSDRFRREPESVCFAGSYYSVGHDERKRQMHALLPSIIEFKGAIYDRFSKLGNDRYKFPEQFQPFIRDAVPFNEVVKLYKHFKVFLNVNTIIDSPTMMSRRVYELLACGTPVVSTPSKAIEEQFPGIVHMANDAQEANKIIEKLLTDEHYWGKTSHLGYREVMTKHTYTHRLQSIKEALGYKTGEEQPLVSIITCTRRPGMIDRIVENMTRQNHPNCELILVLQDFSDAQCNELLAKLKSKPSNLKHIEVIVENSQDITLGERFNHAATYAKGEYIAKMDDDDFYFGYYLSDMLIPFTFGDYGMVGKQELYMYLSGSNKLVKRFPGMKHRVVDFVAGPTFVIKKKVFDQVKFESRNTGEDSTFIKNIQAAGYKIYAADPFNFIQFRADPSKHTWGVSDQEILSGKQTQIVADCLEYNVCDF